jgi:hypothetical protein
MVHCFDETAGAAASMPIRSMRAETDGRFTIDHLEEGRYAIYAWLQKENVFYAGLLRRVEAWDHALDHSVRLVLEEAGEIRIRVPEGRFAKPDDIRLYCLLEAGKEIEVRDFVRISEMAEGKRVYRHRNLLSGAYRIDFRLPSGAISSRYAEVEPGKVLEVRAP